MSFEIKGKLVEKFDMVTISDTFRKREFVIEKRVVFNEREYIDSLKFQLTQDRCDVLDNFNTGEDVLVRFNIRGRKWEKEDRSGYFINLEAWNIENDSLSQEDAPPPHTENDIPPEPEESDLPF